MFGAFKPDKKPIKLEPECNFCRLHLACHSPKMRVDGEGKEKILIVGEAPGAEEDTRGIPFVGPTGRLLEKTLGQSGIDMRRDCWITNAANCRPPRNELPNKAIKYCRPLVIRAIRDLKPEKIFLFGSAAVKSVIGWLWHDNTGGIGRWVGWRIPSQKPNAWICPFWHPSYIARSEDEDKDGGLTRKVWNRQIAEALKTPAGPPWGEVPDWKSLVNVELDPGRAVADIEGFVRRGRPIAFDYETNMLKPDSREAEIYSCSISDGEMTIAYPWMSVTAKATYQLLRSAVPKIGTNIKFEDRWTRKVTGHRVRNWVWDTMLAAHTIDNRPQISGIEFQAFVLLGVAPWDAAVGDYLESPGGGGNTRNRIRQCSLKDVLIYNGLDALIEYKVAMIQSRNLRVQIGGD